MFIVNLHTQVREKRNVKEQNEGNVISDDDLMNTNESMIFHFFVNYLSQSFSIPMEKKLQIQQKCFPFSIFIGTFTKSQYENVSSFLFFIFLSTQTKSMERKLKQVLRIYFIYNFSI